MILPITNVDVIGDVIGDVMWSRNRLYILLTVGFRAQNVTAADLWQFAIKLSLKMTQISAYVVTPCLKKRPTYGLWLGFDTHEQILIFFGRNVTNKVGNQKVF